MNQCDGCRRGLPIVRPGLHRGQGYDIIGCTKHLYEYIDDKRRDREQSTDHEPYAGTMHREDER